MTTKVKITLVIMLILSAVAGFFCLHKIQSRPLKRQSVGIAATPKDKSELLKPGDFSPLQLSLLPEKNLSLVKMDTPVYGVSMGGVVCQKEINGVSVAIAHVLNAQKRGVSMSLVEKSNELQGFSMFCYGGISRNRGFTMGLWNLAEQNNGMQFGVMNKSGQDEFFDYAGKPELKHDDEFGIQTGVVNISDSRGIQFGLWNVNPKSPIKYFPFFNIAL